MYPVDIIKLILNLYIKIKSLRKLEVLVGISRSTIYRWNISIFPAVRNNKINSLSPVIIDVVWLIYKINPFFTITDIQNHLKNACSISCSQSLIKTVVRKQTNLTCKNIFKIFKYALEGKERPKAYCRPKILHKKKTRKTVKVGIIAK